MNPEHGCFHTNPLASKIIDTLRVGKNTPLSYLETTIDGTSHVAEITIARDLILITDPCDETSSFLLQRHRYKDLHDDLAVDKRYIPRGICCPYDYIVSMRVISRHGDMHHPFIYAGAFFDEGFALFRRHGSIKGFFAQWSEHEMFNTNYSMFTEEEKLLRNSGFRDTRTIEFQAAFHTWTGEHVASFGYRCVNLKRTHHPTNNHIYALFY